MDKNIKIILAVLGLVVFFSLGTIFYLIWVDGDSVPDEDEISQVLENDNLDPNEDLEVEDLDAEEKLENDSEDKDSEDEAKKDNNSLKEEDVYDEKYLKDVISKSKSYANARDFQRALAVIEKEKTKIEVQDIDGYDAIRKQEEDLVGLAQLEMQYENGFLYEAMEATKNMNDPENFFLGFLTFNYDYKLNLISSPISLLPPPNPKVKDLTITNITDEIDVTKHVFLADNDIEDFYSINVSLNDVNIDGIIIKKSDGFHIHELTGETKHMITVQDWVDQKGDDFDYEEFFR